MVTQYGCQNRPRNGPPNRTRSTTNTTQRTQHTHTQHEPGLWCKNNVRLSRYDETARLKRLGPLAAGICAHMTKIPAAPCPGVFAIEGLHIPFVCFRVWTFPFFCFPVWQLFLTPTVVRHASHYIYTFQSLYVYVA